MRRDTRRVREKSFEGQSVRLVIAYLLTSSLIQGLTSAAPAYTQTTNQPSTLELTEIASWVVPDSVSLSGITSSPNGSLVLWSQPAGKVIVLSSQLDIEFETTLPSALWPTSVALVGPLTIEVITPNPVAIYRLTAGELVSSVLVDADAFTIDAKHTGSEWTLLLEQPLGALQLCVSTCSNSWDVTALLPGDTIQTAGRAQLSTNWLGSVVTQLTYPFEFTVLDSTFQEIISTRNRNQQLLDYFQRLNSRSTRSYRSVSTLLLDEGYLQTITDLASDTRVLALYDRSGSIIQIRTIDVPLAFVASSLFDQSLYAVRRLNRVEIVKYEWRWSR